MTPGVQGGSGGSSGYIVTEIEPGSRERKVIAKIEHPTESSPHAAKPSFQHQPLATPEYYVMIEAPCYYPTKATVVGSVDWAGFEGNILNKGNIRLVNRATGESTIYPLKSSVFAIHSVNAYREPGTNTLVIDTILSGPSYYSCHFVFDILTLKNYRDNWQVFGFGLHMTKLMRIRVPLDKPGATVEAKQITNITGMEFPTIRYDDLNGKPYRYMYAARISGPWKAFYDSLVKIDVQTGEYLSWGVDGHYTGEPIFVPDPNGSDEDDGTVMTNVLDTIKNQTYLLLLDGKTFKEKARAGPTPHTIPHGYHGRYFDRELNAKPQKAAAHLKEQAVFV
eukprot:TRINITY_DN8593_c0_g3_i2.p1 TRINITY_DN8593_c0_g3~~TRINITY_DN8593_c0_g3_i2.p1  ORF type:complete len:355 (+),score=66.09 TRINITY_DN8593_c0_g3_i2:60-1067(+)